VGAVRGATDSARVVVAGEFLYVADGSGGAAAFSLIRPSDPGLVARLATDASCTDVVPWNDMVIAASGDGGLVTGSLIRYSLRLPMLLR
jgi:hypothetical protein